ncbi:MAG: hypothetical protein ACRD72_25525 [Candidatus Angelobacter sp.]
MKNQTRCFAIATILLWTICPAQADQRSYGVRETIGTVETKGWEANLVRGNPNLAHWHWDPIYSNPQGMKYISPINIGGKQSAPTGGHYIKPAHVPTIIPVQHRDELQDYKDAIARRHQEEVKAQLAQEKVKARLAQEKVRAQLAQQKTHAALDNGDIFGNLVDKQLAGQMLPPGPVVATYGNDYTFPSGSGNWRATERAEVHGKIATSKPSKAAKALRY